jgi:hypothetical protein
MLVHPRPLVAPEDTLQCGDMGTALRDAGLIGFGVATLRRG